MKEMRLKRSWRRVVGGVCCGSLLCIPARAAGRPASAWEKAVAGRTALDRATATRAEWNRVLDGFRSIYHDNPAETHAPDAVNAVAELLAEEGRAAGETRLLRAAVGQYEFLRTQYPGSRLRVSALLAEGHLEEELGDAAGAKKAYAGVVREAPGSEAAGVARDRMRGMVPTHRDVAAINGPAGVVGASVGVAGSAPTRDDLASGSAIAGRPGGRGDGQEKLAVVTGIRHWSTASYTRVAIDLGDEVKFEAARVPGPDRIYFDLHGARLAPELVGKTFAVTDEGFLTKIRAAQAAGDVARVVLDVSDVTEYSAFLLPNPYRLIIDIHGKKALGAAPADVISVPVPAGAGRMASAAANRSGLPAMAVTGEAAPEQGKGSPDETVRRAPERREEDAVAVRAEKTAVRVAVAPRTGVVTGATAARPVPNAVGVKVAGTATEVAAVSLAPGRVEATSAPTSKPIAVVARNPIHRDEAAVNGAPGADSRDTSHDRLATGPLIPGHPVLDGAPAKAAERTAAGETSLVRALGLKVGRIVIDAGHGGHDSGTLGVDGIQEKDVVLDVALRLGRMLHERLGAEIIYTRSDDTFIPLETRTAIANKAQADLFLSIHANSSQDPASRGVETYYLNFTSDPTALDVAARENAVGGQGVHQLSDLVKKIALKDKIAESREFAADVEASLYAGLEKGNAGLRNRGVKKAPFVVLIGANMPSILAEISFVTNARDADQLREPEYRERVAESLFHGVAKYEGGLAGARPLPSVRAAR